MNETCMNHALNMPNIGGCPYCRIDELEQQLADAQSELALPIKERIELGGKLSRYQGGVEVESRLLVDDNEVQLVSDVREWPIGHGFDIGQQVRVLVMPKEAE